jgi:hypothetical protein
MSDISWHSQSFTEIRTFLKLGSANQNNESSCRPNCRGLLLYPIMCQLIWMSHLFLRIMLCSSLVNLIGMWTCMLFHWSFTSLLHGQLIDSTFVVHDLLLSVDWFKRFPRSKLEGTKRFNLNLNYINSEDRLTWFQFKFGSSLDEAHCLHTTIYLTHTVSKARNFVIFNFRGMMALYIIH